MAIPFRYIAPRLSMASVSGSSLLGSDVRAVGSSSLIPGCSAKVVETMKKMSSRNMTSMSDVMFIVGRCLFRSRICMTFTS